MTSLKPRGLSVAASLTAVATAQARLDKAVRNSKDAAAIRDDALLAAAAAGATRAMLEERTGLSQARITQVLRRARLANERAQVG